MEQLPLGKGSIGTYSRLLRESPKDQSSPSDVGRYQLPQSTSCDYYLWTPGVPTRGDVCVGGAEGTHCVYEVGLAHLSRVPGYEQGISYLSVIVCANTLLVFVRRLHTRLR